MFYGVRGDTIFYPVASNDKIAGNLMELLKDAQDDDMDSEAQAPDFSGGDELELLHRAQWSRELEKHKDKTFKVAAHKRSSLEKSHEARRRILMQRMDTANDNIRRMRTSEIASVENDYMQRVEELDAAKEGADITAQPVAYGTIRIYRE